MRDAYYSYICIGKEKVGECFRFGYGMVLKERTASIGALEYHKIAKLPNFKKYKKLKGEIKG